METRSIVMKSSLWNLFSFTNKHAETHTHTRTHSHTHTHTCWNWAFGLFLESSKFLVVTKPSCSNKACSYKDNCVLDMTTIESCWHLNYKINILLYHSLTKLTMGLLLLENLWETTQLALLQPGKKYAEIEPLVCS